VKAFLYSCAINFFKVLVWLAYYFIVNRWYIKKSERDYIKGYYVLDRHPMSTYPHSHMVVASGLSRCDAIKLCRELRKEKYGIKNLFNRKMF
jgi:hypothetical protein